MRIAELRYPIPNRPRRPPDRRMLMAMAWLFVTLSSVSTLAQPNPPRAQEPGGRVLLTVAVGESLPEQLRGEMRSTAIELRQRIDRAAAAVHGEEHGWTTDETYLAEQQKELDEAVQAYRALVLVYADMAAEKIPAEHRTQRMHGYYKDAFAPVQYGMLIQRAERRIERAEKNGEGDLARAATRGRLLALIQEQGALGEIACRIDPWQSPMEFRENLGLDIDARRTQPVPRAVNVLRRLADRIHSMNPDVPDVTEGGDQDFKTALRIEYQQNLLDEFRLAASTLPMTHRVTQRPITGPLRIRLAGNALRYLQYRLDKKAEQDEDVTAIFDLFSIDWGKTRRDLERTVKQTLEQWEAYQAAAMVRPAFEPNPKEYFLAVSRVIRSRQQKVQDWYRDDYVGGEGVLDWNLDQLFRVHGVDTLHAESSDEEVRERIDTYMARTDRFCEMLENAASVDDPAELPKTTLRVLKAYGYVRVHPDGSLAFVVSPEARQLHKHVDKLEGQLDLPGASPLSVITPKSVGIAAASVLAPQLASSAMVHAISAAGFSQRAAMVGGVVAETAAGLVTDATIEYMERGRIDAGQLVLESVVLGGGMQGLGGASQGLSTWTMRQAASIGPGKRFAQMMTERPRLKAWAQNAATKTMDLGFEAGATAAFHAAAGDAELSVNSALSFALEGALARAASREYQDVHITRDQISKLVRGKLKELRPAGQSNRQFEQRVHDQLVEMVVAQRRRIADAQRRLDTLSFHYDDINPKNVFEACRRGLIEWNDLRLVYAEAPDGDPGLLNEVRELRDAHFKDLAREARRESLNEATRIFNERHARLTQREATDAEVQDLITWFEEEIEAINEGVITPGSKEPTSDIDRSAPSEIFRQQLRRAYHRRGLEVDVVPPPSLVGFDVVEYINVFTQITENGQFVEQMRGLPLGEAWGGMRHGEAMKALAFAGAMRNMDAAQRETYPESYIAAEVERLQRAGADAARIEQIRRDLRRQFDVAKQSLADSGEALKPHLEEMSRKMGLPEDHPHVEIEARDALYGERMQQFERDVRRLRRMSEAEQQSEDGLRLRAKIERNMSIAMRDGLETYANPVGLDIVVNHVQATEVDDPSAEGGKRPMEIAERLADPHFVVGQGDLAAYTKAEADAMLADQVMFMAEHVNGFMAGHETAYEAGRGLGKYLERAFLAMKIGGLDIHAVRERAPEDPTRRLLEISQQLVANKSKPHQLKKVLENAALRFPYTAEMGVIELCRLMEEVVPGMRGLTNYDEMIPPPSLSKSGAGGDEAGPTAAPRHSMHRRMRMNVHRRRKNDQARLLELRGPVAVRNRLRSERQRLKAELAQIEQELELLTAKVREAPRDPQLALKRKRELEAARTVQTHLLQLPARAWAPEVYEDVEYAEKQYEAASQPAADLGPAEIARRHAAYARRLARRDHLRYLLKQIEREHREVQKLIPPFERAENHPLNGTWDTEPGAATSNVQMSVQRTERGVRIRVKSEAFKDGQWAYTAMLQQYGAELFGMLVAKPIAVPPGMQRRDDPPMRWPITLKLDPDKGTLRVTDADGMHTLIERKHHEARLLYPGMTFVPFEKDPRLLEITRLHHRAKAQFKSLKQAIRRSHEQFAEQMRGKSYLHRHDVEVFEVDDDELPPHIDLDHALGLVGGPQLDAEAAFDRMKHDDQLRQHNGPYARAVIEIIESVQFALAATWRYHFAEAHARAQVCLAPPQNKLNELAEQERKKRVELSRELHGAEEESAKQELEQRIAKQEQQVMAEARKDLRRIVDDLKQHREEIADQFVAWTRQQRSLSIWGLEKAEDSFAFKWDPPVPFRYFLIHSRHVMRASLDLEPYYEVYPDQLPESDNSPDVRFARDHKLPRSTFQRIDVREGLNFTVIRGYPWEHSPKPEHRVQIFQFDIVDRPLSNRLTPDPR